MAIPLTNITIPTPEPFDKQAATRNQENYYYVYLQLLQAAKTAGESVTFNPSTALSMDLSAVVQALHDLQFNGQIFDFGGLRLKFEGKASGIGV